MDAHAPSLTPRERAVFEFVYDELDGANPGPSLAEIAEEFDFHRTNAWRLVFSLINKGYLRRRPRQHRGLEVTALGHDFQRELEVQHRRRRPGSLPLSSTAARVLAGLRSQLRALPVGERQVVVQSLLS